MMNEISFFVPGIPRPGGSKRVFPIKKGGAYTGRFIVTDAAGQANKDWRASVAHGAREAFACEPWNCAIELELEFRMPRPKGHLRSTKGAITADGFVQDVKATAPRFHITRPDAGKLARSTTDALTHILWADDSQIVKETNTKAYSGQPGCWIVMREAQ